MPRIVKSPEIRKQELTEIALRQFLEKGYEKTSIRSILKEANGEIGMFYHYFQSKKQVYEAALEKYNEDYISKIKEVVTTPVLSFEEKLRHIFSDLPGSICEYGLMYTKKANPDLLTILHARTLMKLVPLFEELLLIGAREKTLHLPLSDTRQLAEFLLFGASAIIHDHTVADLALKSSHIRSLLDKLLDTNL